MEDLASVGFTETTDKLSVDQAKVVLRWLGAFHARFLGQQGAIKQRKIKIWDEGSYWHLGTREDEYNAMEESPLKQAAFKIAKSLSNATYQTVIHGDAKVANFCFTQSYNACAAVDFQYVGFGVGVKDVAYFIGSALSEDDQKHYTENCLSVYFEALKEAFLLRDAQETDSLTKVIVRPCGTCWQFFSNSRPYSALLSFYLRTRLNKVKTITLRIYYVQAQALFIWPAFNIYSTDCTSQCCRIGTFNSH
jgi:thiamine kinase-like enzyme